MPKVLSVFNLEFPSQCQSIKLCGYTFARTDDYAKKQEQLHCLVNSCGSEFPTKMRIGHHAHTANVVVHDSETKAIIDFDSNATALDDAILLLRLFTGREVFCVELSEGETLDDVPIVFDHNMYRWGGVLHCSLPHSGERIRHQYHDTTLELQLPKIYEQIQSRDWQRTYKRGRYLRLFGEAIKQQRLESAFTQCWTIWEHLFACLNDSWLSNQENRRLAAREKIAFLLVRFALRDGLQENEKDRLKELVDIRNRLIHYGLFPQKSTVHHNAEVFIRMTEFIVAKSLGLEPSNLFNTIERLEDFLQNKAKAKPQP